MERRQEILAALRRRSPLRLTDLASMLHVSTMTIRRDVEVLAAEGSVAKTRGGVLLTQPAEPALPLVSSPEKRAIAREAARLVEPGSVVGITSGSTMALLAAYLHETPNITVVTNSLRVADIFDPIGTATVDGPDHSVVLTGGLRTPAGALVGPVAVAALSQLHCDQVFLSGDGLAPATGLTTRNLLEAETDRAFVAAGQRTIVVADSSKWLQISLATIVELDAIDILVMDDGLGEAPLDDVRAHVSALRVAAVSAAPD
jgi:DeoR/GlpR family transcriptional regulator of sugar metabolism